MAASYALRELMRAPGYATPAIVTLALGIGANTAIFAVVDAAVFKPLPYRAPEKLVTVAADVPARRATRVNPIAVLRSE